MSEEETKTNKKRDVNWLAVLWYIHLHMLGTYGIWELVVRAKWLTVLFAFLVTYIACLGITIGAHRLWAHRTYTATKTIRIFLVLAHTLAGVGPLYDWVLAHRVHHAYYGTEYDPFNHKKGFWYCHVMSNVLVPHPDSERIEKAIDMRDMQDDMFVWIQKKFYWPLFIFVSLLLPLNAPIEYWGESMITTIFVLGFLRFAVTLNAACLVNSAMLIWNLGPKDKVPPDDKWIFLLTRSFWPAYHYLMPWDWKSEEYGRYDRGCNNFILRTWFNLGLIKQMKTTSTEQIRDYLYNIACKKVSKKELIDKLKEQCELDSLRTELEFHH